VKFEDSLKLYRRIEVVSQGEPTGTV